MDWMKIVAAGAMIMMIIFIWPRAKAAMQSSPEGSSGDWLSALIPLALVGAFIAFLVALV